MASIRKRTDRPKQWEAVYRDPAGRQRTRSFARKADAARFLTTVEHTLLTGSYVDPAAGKVTFAVFAERWLATQTSDVFTRDAMASRLKVHLLPTFGDVELRAIRPSTVQAWLRGWQQVCAPTFVRLLLANLSAILGAAVDDDLIARNPCRSASVKAPASNSGRSSPGAASRSRS